MAGYFIGVDRPSNAVFSMLFAFYGNIKIYIYLYRWRKKILIVSTSYPFLSFNNIISTTSLFVIV